MGTRYHGTACKTCRRRGRKCSKELPLCRSCSQKGIQCEGYTFRWAGIASRGHLAGKQTLTDTQALQKPASNPGAQTTDACQAEPHTEVERQQMRVVDETQELARSTTRSPRPSTCNLTTCINAEVPDMNDLVSDLSLSTAAGLPSGLVDAPYQSREAYDLAIAVPSYGSFLDPYKIPFDLKFILNYHSLEVAPRLCVDNANSSNPYTQYITPLALQKPPLLYACAALAACHFSTRLDDQTFLVSCLKYRGKAMRRLQEQLWSEQSAKDEGNLATVLMLTLTDMCLGGFSHFDAHFRAARRLIDLRGCSRTQDSFVEQYIGWLDIMSAASSSREPVFGSQEVMEVTGCPRKWIHDVIPCSPAQFAIISELVELYKSLDDPEHPDPVTLARVKSLRTDLLTQAVHTERGLFWMHLTEAYKHAILLYIIQLFRRDADEDEVAWLTQSVIYHAKCTPPATGWSDQLLWPLFHAGLEIRDERRKTWLRERFKVMQLSGGFGNVKTATSILERVWSGDRPSDYMSLLSEDGIANMLVV